MRVLLYLTTLMILGLTLAYPAEEAPIEDINLESNAEDLIAVSDQGHENQNGRYARQLFGGGFGHGGFGHRGFDHGGFGHGGFGHGGFGHGGFGHGGFGHGGFGHGGFGHARFGHFG